MSDSMWKKEISFKRKPKGDAEPPAEKQSFWKKELSLSRKGKDDETWENPAAPKQSFLKKEISFSRKAKEKNAPEPAREPKPPKQSVWKYRSTAIPRRAPKSPSPRAMNWRKQSRFCSALVRYGSPRRTSSRRQIRPNACRCWFAGDAVSAPRVRKS